MSFKDKVAIVTGASSGIGAAIAILLAKEGASVTIVGRNEEKLKAVVEKCDKVGRKPLVIKADVTDAKEAKKIVEKTVEVLSKIDVLVNNAGFSKLGSIADGKIVEAYDEIMKTNVRAVIQLTALAAPYLRKTKGNVVNISSVAALNTPRHPAHLPYCISKAALDHFTRGVAVELGEFGVRVNSVNPGPVRTDFLEKAGYEGSVDDLKTNTTLKRVSEPEEIADLVAFLASAKAVGITGSIFLNDNGYTIARPNLK